MNTNTHTNGSARISNDSDDSVRPEPRKTYEKRPHTIASLKRMAKQEEQNVRKVRKATEKKEALLARIEKAREEGYQARQTDKAVDEVIASKVGSRYV